MLKIEGKTFMNIQEAVQWLLENNALPFQSTANYAPLTEIGLGTIVNPTPAKVRIGSLIFFADSKVSTVVGITENGFICSDQYNNLVDDVAHVVSVAINASGHLITTFSDGQTQDAGLIKQVSNFSIDASQHLVVTYNDGTSTDLGAIFNGNLNISGDIYASGTISAPSVTGDSIIQNMPSGYGFNLTPVSGYTIENVYGSMAQNGNKLTIVLALNITRNTGATTGQKGLGYILVPTAVGQKLYPVTVGLYQFLANNKILMFENYDDVIEEIYYISKNNNNELPLVLDVRNMVENKKYYARFEITFLLSNNMLS